MTTEHLLGTPTLQLSETTLPPSRYWCFISYSRTDANEAARIQRFLENYRLPGRLGRSVIPPKGLTVRIRPVFRDLTDLSATPHLSEGLQDALRASANLVVLCSPQAAFSEWVDNEIEYFRSLNHDNAIFCVLLSGEPNSEDTSVECLPPSLRLLGRGAQPLLADVRGGRAAFRQGCLRLIAGLHKISLDDLVRRHVRRQRRLAVLATAVGCAVGIVGAGLLAHGAADKLYAEAITQARSAEAAGRPSSADSAFSLPTWAAYFSSPAYRNQVEELKSRLSYEAGVDASPSIDLNMPLDPKFAQNLIFSGDFRRLATPEFDVTMDGSKHWLSVFDRTTGKRISRLAGDFELPSLVLNYDGKVFAAHIDGKIIFRSAETGNEINATADEDHGEVLLFAAPTRDRLITFTTSSRHLMLINTTTGVKVAKVGTQNGSPVKAIAYQDTVEMRHMGVLFKDGEVHLADLESGASVPANLPGGSASDILWTSSARDALLLSRSGELALYIEGHPDPVVVTKPPIKNVALGAAPSDSRFAVVGKEAKDEILFFDTQAPDKFERHKLPAEINAIRSSGGQKSVFAALETGETYLIVDGEENPIEVFGRRMALSSISIDEHAGLYAVGSENGYFVVGDADTGVVLRERRFGSTPILSLLIDPLGRGVEIISGDGQRERQELAPRRLIASWRVPNFTALDLSDEEERCRHIAISSGLNALAVHTKGGVTIYRPDGNLNGVFQTKPGKLFHPRPTFEFNPTGRWIVFSYFGMPINIIDSQTGLSAKAHPDYPKFIASLDYDNCPASFSTALAWKDEDTFTLKTDSGRTETWQIRASMDRNAPALAMIGQDPGTPMMQDVVEPPTMITSPAGDREIVHEQGQMPVLRRRSDSKVIAVLDHFSPYANLIFSPDGSRLLIASSTSGKDDNGRFYSGYALIDSSTGEPIVEDHRQWIVDVSRIRFTPDGKYLLVNARGGSDFGFDGVETSAKLIDAISGELIFDFASIFGNALTDTPPGGYADTEFSPDGATLYGIRYSGILDIWRLDSKAPTPVLRD